MNKDNIQDVFSHQAAQIHRLRGESARVRKQKLREVARYLNAEENQQRLFAAMHSDLHKPPTEVILTEVGPVLMAIKHICSHLSSWMRTDFVPVPLSMIGLRAHVAYQSKGNCLVISPWNYPFQLSLLPLIHAVAAGNPVILKPSEHSPATTDFLIKMIADLFDPCEVTVIPGEVDVSTALLELPFHHIFFTGSPQVGKIVMAAAAKNLSSVTLELGGKSPAIIDSSVNLRKVAEKTAWAKCMNAGQTCIAPDYVLLQEGLQAAFVKEYAAAVQRLYNPKGKGLAASPDYGRIIHDRHFQRLKRLVEDARSKGATVLLDGANDPETRLFPPILLGKLNESMDMMQEEIFGPILPIVPFKSIREVPNIIAQRPHPLAFYIMSKKKRHVDYLMHHSSSGGVVVNDYMVSSINPDLPFGGVNHSGIGKSNGWHGFVEFSNLRGVTERKWFNFKMIYPPFSAGKERLAKFLYKYF